MDLINHLSNLYIRRYVFITRPRMGPSLGFVTGFVLSSVTYYGLFYCTIGFPFVLRHWRLFFSIRFEFQVIRKGCEGSGDDS